MGNAVTVPRNINANTGRFIPGTVTAAYTGNETLVVGAPTNNLANTFLLTDDPLNPRAANTAQFFAVQDHNNAPIFSIPPAGGPKAYGDYMGCWTGTATPSTTFTPWDGFQFVGAGVGVFTGPTIYGGTGAPLPASTVTKLGTFTQVANVGDLYWRQDTSQWYTCTVAGTGGSRGGTWTPNYTVAGNITATFGNFDASLAGTGFKAAEGSNAKQGTFTLSGAATTVVANTSITANSRIFLQTQALGTVTAASTLAVSARTAGTSFTVTPSQSTDTSTIAFEIFEPG